MPSTSAKVPGRKTDVQDAEWLADLLQHGLLTPSFVPCQAQQDLRDLTRLRLRLVQDHAQLTNRLHEVRGSCAGSNWPRSGVACSGSEARAVLYALCMGERDPRRLAERVHRSVRATPEQLVEALDVRSALPSPDPAAGIADFAGRSGAVDPAGGE